MKLSILICSLDQRYSLLIGFLKSLQKQVLDNKEVEVLVFINNGRRTIGTIRNKLVSHAKGEYVCFVDDDDIIPEYYIKEILKNTKNNPDCVGFFGTISIDGKNKRKFIHSIKYKNWFELNGIFYRCPNHLNPIKSRIVRSTPFPEINYAEDRNFSMKLRGKLKTENYINKNMYNYRYLSNKSRINKIRFKNKNNGIYSMQDLL